MCGEVVRVQGQWYPTLRKEREGWGTRLFVLAGERKETRGESLGFAVSDSSLHHDLLYMAGVLKWVAIENNNIRILAFAK